MEAFLLSVGGYTKSEKIFSCNIAIVKAFYSACGFKYSGALLYAGIEDRWDVKSREAIKRDAVRAAKEFVGGYYSNL